MSVTPSKTPCLLERHSDSVDVPIPAQSAELTSFWTNTKLMGRHALLLSKAESSGQQKGIRLVQVLMALIMINNCTLPIPGENR
jgi:hypothetical protein